MVASHENPFAKSAFADTRQAMPMSTPHTTASERGRSNPLLETFRTGTSSPAYTRHRNATTDALALIDAALAGAPPCSDESATSSDETVECASCGKRTTTLEADLRHFNRGRCGKCGGPLFPIEHACVSVPPPPATPSRPVPPDP